VALTRIASGSYQLEHAVSLQELEDAFARGCGESLLLSLDAALESMPAITVETDDVLKITQGRRVQTEEDLDAELCRAYATDGSFVAILRRQSDGQWQPHKVFAKSGR
jgi:tRNA pseudouridine55 synthase